MKTVNVKLADGCETWENLPFVNMVFNNEQEAIAFALHLAYFHKSQVRLDFSDFTGKCNGNGHYYHYSQR